MTGPRRGIRPQRPVWIQDNSGGHPGSRAPVGSAEASVVTVQWPSLSLSPVLLPSLCFQVWLEEPAPTCLPHKSASEPQSIVQGSCPLTSVFSSSLQVGGR